MTEEHLRGTEMVGGGPHVGQAVTAAREPVPGSSLSFSRRAHHLHLHHHLEALPLPLERQSRVLSELTLLHFADQPVCQYPTERAYGNQ